MRQTQRALAVFPVRGFGFVPLADSATLHGRFAGVASSRARRRRDAIRRMSHDLSDRRF